MRIVHSTALAAALLAIFAACADSPTNPGAAAAPSARRMYTNGTQICSNQAVPAGYVIISASSVMSCPNWSPTLYNRYLVGIPGTQEIVCSNSPVPSNYVLISVGSNTNCPNWTATTKNTYSIKIPASTEVVCSISPVPAGYVVISTGNNTNCPNWSPTAQNTKTIQL